MTKDKYFLGNVAVLVSAQSQEDADAQLAHVLISLTHDCLKGIKLMGDAQELEYDTSNKPKEVFKMLQQEADNTVHGWTIEDVHDEAERGNKIISGDQARAVIQFINKNYDANSGINWQTIEDAINAVVGDNYSIKIDRADPLAPMKHIFSHFNHALAQHSPHVEDLNLGDRYNANKDKG